MRIKPHAMRGLTKSLQCADDFRNGIRGVLTAAASGIYR
ncbi:MAG: hypothetical protein OJF48_000226 [Afipia sp.]|nr:MAG: hypothetical protein OJF48_000226 [Afipia sp.]